MKYNTSYTDRVNTYLDSITVKYGIRQQKKRIHDQYMNALFFNLSQTVSKSYLSRSSERTSASSAPMLRIAK